MRIRLVAIGNQEEAYVERNFTAGINIISSDDNNKGKTIVIQALMFAMGNEPAFPSSFSYKDYDYVLQFESNEVIYTILRKLDTFVIRHENELMILDSVSELKRYWHRNIFELPIILHKGMTRIVDPVLFLQLFFVGQDKKDTTNIANHGWYGKEDYYNMIYSFVGINHVKKEIDSIDVAKAEIDRLKEDRESILKQYKILKSKKKAASYLSAINDKLAFQLRIAELTRIKDQISEYRKLRNHAASRRAMWETTIKELRSLNRTIEHGELRCLDCNSSHIAYKGAKKGTYSFDVSTAEMRDQIINSIYEQIAAYSEEIEKLSVAIQDEQDKLKLLMREDDISLESIVAMKQDILSVEDAESAVSSIEQRIRELQESVDCGVQNMQDTKEQQGLLLQKIVEVMNQTYNEIDPNGNLSIAGLFTTRGQLYSGSEATIFHLLKLYALCVVLKHSYPIVIDSFRAEDLSTEKEAKVIEILGRLPNQIIITTTLKQEEFGKYDNRTKINSIDYKDHAPSKLLSATYLDQFNALISEIGLM